MHLAPGCETVRPVIQVGRFTVTPWATPHVTVTLFKVTWRRVRAVTTTRGISRGPAIIVRVTVTVTVTQAQAGPPAGSLAARGMIIS